MDRPSLNEEVSSARERVARIAVSILAGSVDILDASLEIYRLRSQADVSDRDEDFEAFVLVVSDTDTLPFGPQRQFWDEQVLRQREPELVHARKWAFDVVENACRNLVTRFAVPPN